MKKLISLLLVVCLLLPLAVLCEESGPASVPQDNLAVTRHTAAIAGKTVDYTATAGTMVMDTALGKYEIFFIAYTADGTEDLTKRPVTFAFNGGPGSASLWLNLGLLGPEKVALDPEGMLEKVPAGTKPNEYSILDMTDLVFIDPVGTGYSRALPGTEEETFYSYDNDNASVGDFIRQYVARNGRWESPKYLAGESYGTVRAVGVCDYLQKTYHMATNGLLLVSTANDYDAMQPRTGNLMPYISYLPGFAATAWYHKKAAQRYLDMELEAFLEEARNFASGEYLSALYQGTRLSTEEQERVAEKAAEFIGLEKEYILKKNLRVSMDDFCTELLSDRKLMVGRIDSRYTGPMVDGELGDGTSDPSSLGINEAFASAMNSYTAQDLQYVTDRPYEVLSLAVNGKWSYFGDNIIVAQEDLIRNCMSENRFLKVWVVCGYYDLATPFYGAEWVFSHIFLNEELEKNLRFRYYPAGHMFYLLDANVQAFREDAEAWFCN